MTRIILTVGCVGKTYIDNHYTNIYDFDKHTLGFHRSMIPFDDLTKEVQELDNPYVKKLNDVLSYFKGLKKLVL